VGQAAVHPGIGARCQAEVEQLGIGERHAAVDLFRSLHHLPKMIGQASLVVLGENLSILGQTKPDEAGIVHNVKDVGKPGTGIRLEPSERK
jgi:hypothetical protein